MAKGVKMLAALMDDEGANGDDLMMAAKQVNLLTHPFFKGCHPIGLDLKYIYYHVTHFQLIK